MQTFWLFASILSSFLLSSSCITVHVKSSGTSKACSIKERLLCPTLDAAYEEVKGQRNVTLIIESNTTIQNSLKFINVSEVTIKGINSNRLVIKCNGNYGMYFENVSNVSLSNLSLAGCMFNHTYYLSAVIFNRCTGIKIFNFDFVNNSKSGLTLFNCSGTVNLTSTNFTHNGHRTQFCGRKYGALNINNRDSVGYFYLNSCHFLYNSNKGSCTKDYPQIDHWGTSRLGGGMRVIFGSNSTGNKVIVSKCNFTGNEAGYGAGIYTQYQDYSEGNYILIDKTILLNNSAKHGGGGLSINLVSYNSVHYNRTNSVHVTSTDFIKNSADYGVGVWITSRFSNVTRKGGIHFSQCNWEGNRGRRLSPALDIGSYVNNNKERRGHLPVVHFWDINVTDNIVHTDGQLLVTHDKDSGVLLVAESKIVFGGVNTFADNSPSALQAVSGVISLLNDTQMIFNNNSAVNGAAIALYGYSHIILHRNVTLIFSNNVATSFGGGIYHQLD